MSESQPGSSSLREWPILRLESLLDLARSSDLDVSFASPTWNPLELATSTIDAGEKDADEQGERAHPADIHASALHALHSSADSWWVVQPGQLDDEELGAHTWAFAVVSRKYASVLCIKNPKVGQAGTVKHLCRIAEQTLQDVCVREKQSLAQQLSVELGRQVQDETLLDTKAPGKAERNLEQMGNADLDVTIFDNAANYLCQVLQAQGCTIFDLTEFRMSCDSPSQSNTHSYASESNAKGLSTVGEEETVDGGAMTSERGVANGGSEANDAGELRDILSPMPSSGSSFFTSRSRNFSASGVTEYFVASGGGKTHCSFTASSQPVRILGHAGLWRNHFDQLPGDESRLVVAQYLSMARSSGLNSKAYMENRSAPKTSMWELAPPQAHTYLCCSVAEADSQPAFLLYAYFCDANVAFDKTEELFVEQVGAYLIYSSIRSRVLAVDRAQMRFAQRIQHELRTPLHAIIGVNEIAKESLRRSENLEGMRDLIDSISISADALNVLVDDMVDFSLMERLCGERQMMEVTKTRSDWESVCGVITSTCLHAFRLTQRLSKAEQSSSMAPPPEMFVTLTDIDAFDWSDFKAQTDLEIIRRITWKLVMNALQATKEGLIEIIVSLKSSSELQTDKESIERLQIEVHDTGKGMDEKFVEERLFHPFGKEDEESGGVGLSLSICHLLAAQLSGRLMAESTVGRGTKMTLSLPLKRASKVNRRAKTVHDGPTIFFLDFDTPSKRLFVSRTLKQFGCKETKDIHTAAIAVISVEEDNLQLKEVPQIAELQKRQTFVDVVFMPVFNLRDFKEDHANQLEELEGITGHNSRVLQRPLNVQGIREFASVVQAARERASMVDAADNGMPLAHRLALGLTLPSSAKADSPRGDSDGSEVRVHEHPFTVLVVEDNPLNARIMTTMLKRTKVDYLVAGNGKEGLEAFEKHLPILVLLDINMPVMNGYEACREMRRVPSRYVHRIIAITALSTEADKRRGFEAGMDDWHTKPTRMAPLMRDIKRWRREYLGLPSSSTSTASH